MEPDPFVAIRSACRAYPGATEEYPWGCHVWKVGGKVFAYAAEGETWVTIASTPDRQESLVQDPAITRASHMGRFGWVTVNATSPEVLDVALDLIEDAYALILGRLPRKARAAVEALSIRAKD